MSIKNSQKGSIEISTIAAMAIIAAMVAAVSIYATIKYYETPSVTAPIAAATPKLTTNKTSTPTYQPTQAVYQKTIIKQIIIKTGIDIDKPRQELPYDLKTAKGHYLIWIYETNKLIYDGKELYSEKNLNRTALSRNGLHYAYVINNDLYIDGQKITSAYNLQLPTITNDLGHYFYTTTTQVRSIGNILLKDGKEILKHDAGILGLWINENGSTYLAELRNIENGNFIDSLILNGKEIYKGKELKEKMLSDNGQHYAYVVSPSEIGGNDGRFIIDGNIKLEGQNLNFSQITNLGHYAITDTNNNKIYIDNKSYNITNNTARAFINNDASHYLYNDGGWKLDGDAISIENAEGGIEIEDNIVYAYGLVK